LKLIQGVAVRELKSIHDERGWLVEILRSDWDIFEKFGQAYITTAYPGVVKAWHGHRKQTDYFTCIDGVLKVALYDSRTNSATYREINEFFIGEETRAIIKIPPLVYHGFKAIGTKTAYVLNVTTELYDYKNPDELRLPPDTKEIAYEWRLTPGLKHG